LADPAAVESTVVHFDAADGTRLGLHVIGDGPAVVCVPGGPGRASAYLEDLAGLSATHTLLRFDLRGTGASELPEDRQSLSFPRLADDIEDLRVARGLDTIDLLAHSAGCFVALVYAARYPERLSRLILLTPSGTGFGDVGNVGDDIKAIRASRSGEPWYAEAAAVEAEVAMAPPHRRDRPHRELRVFSYGRWDERAQAHAAATDSQMSLRAMAAFGPASFEGESFLAAVKAFAGPTLIVVGTVDGATGVEAGQVIAAALTNVRVAEIAGAGHYPWVDTPDELRDVLVSFLAEARPAARP
jgi:pimeloyl-ACP methyl ester carboxylesterase